MARGRILSRNIAHDAKFNKLSIPNQWFFMRILPFADDHGRINANLEELHLECLPYFKDFKLDMSRGHLNKLQDAGIVEWKEDVVIQLKNFRKHQKIGHRPAESKFPNVHGEYDKLSKLSEGEVKKKKDFRQTTGGQFIAYCSKCGKDLYFWGKHLIKDPTPCCKAEFVAKGN